MACNTRTRTRHVVLGNRMGVLSSVGLENRRLCPVAAHRRRSGMEILCAVVPLVRVSKMSLTMSSVDFSTTWLTRFA